MAGAPTGPRRLRVTSRQRELWAGASLEGFVEQTAGPASEGLPQNLFVREINVYFV